jgi:hypothetical protein
VKKSDYIAVRGSGHKQEMSCYVRIDSITAVKEVYFKTECNCGKGNCEYGTHRYDDLFVYVEGEWFFVGSFDYDPDINALDRLSEVINKPKK